MMAWLLPALGFVLTTGLLGVTSKLALRSVDWPELVLWTSGAYLTAAAALLLTGTVRFQWGSDTPWAVTTGLLPVVSLILFFLAVGATEVSRVVPITAGYPLVTALAAVLLLSETISLGRAVGILLVVTGVIMLSR